MKMRKIILIISTIFVNFGMAFLLLGAEAETLKELQLQLQIVDAQQKHAIEAFERGRAEIQAGSLRQGVSTTWTRELKAERARVEAKIKELKEKGK